MVNIALEYAYYRLVPFNCIQWVKRLQTLLSISRCFFFFFFTLRQFKCDISNCMLKLAGFIRPLALLLRFRQISQQRVVELTFHRGELTLGAVSEHLRPVLQNHLWKQSDKKKKTERERAIKNEKASGPTAVTVMSLQLAHNSLESESCLSVSDYHGCANTGRLLERCVWLALKYVFLFLIIWLGLVLVTCHEANSNI